MSSVHSNVIPIVALLYLIFTLLTYFISGSVYLLTPFTHFPPHLRDPSSPVATIMFFVSVIFVLFVRFLNSTFKWNHMVFYFSALVCSLSVILLRSIHAIANGKISFFLLSPFFWLGSFPFTLLTKFFIVKAVVFPVVIYGCESWPINKAECQRIDAFKLWC